MAGENCTSGCHTRDHESWGECARAKRMVVGYAASAKGIDKTQANRWEAELNDYRELRDQGIQPAGTSRMHIEAAKEISDVSGQAYNAEAISPQDAHAAVSFERETGLKLEDVMV